MILFRRRQLATLIFFLVGIPVLIIAAVLAVVEFDPIALAVLLLLLVCLILFGSLTVQVSKTEVHLHFGPGLIRRSFAIANIRRATTVRNRWQYGLGIRRLPQGWLYNVSGLDAVELEMADGQVHRIGTDRPVELLAAIKIAQGASGQGDRFPDLLRPGCGS